jgi:hypothetical protein
VLATQAVAWLAYAISGRYGPWSWVKIGFAYALTSARVPFEVTARGGAEPFDTMEVALGAFVAAAIVLAFRAGRDQAKGLETEPVNAALAGAMIAPGFAIAMVVAAYAVRLGFPNLGIEVLEPVLWAAFVFPFVEAGVAGALGGLARVRRHRRAQDPRVPSPRTTGAPGDGRAAVIVRAGAVACGWGLVFATLASLLLAAVEMDVTKAYGRFIGRSERVGAIALVHHALVLPNQSALVLGATMGVPAELSVGEARAATIGLRGFEAEGNFRGLFGGPRDRHAGSFPAPGWYLVFHVVPAAATVMGGRAAGEGARSPLVATWSGALAGVVFAALCVLAIWAAGVALPLLPGVLQGSVRLEAPLGRLAVFALGWGVAGCTIGALSMAWERREPRREGAGAA